MDQPGGDNEYVVTVTVFWKSGSVDRNIVLRESLLNWTGP